MRPSPLPLPDSYVSLCVHVW